VPARRSALFIKYGLPLPWLVGLTDVSALRHTGVAGGLLTVKIYNIEKAISILS